MRKKRDLPCASDRAMTVITTAIDVAFHCEGNASSNEKHTKQVMALTRALY